MRRCLAALLPPLLSACAAEPELPTRAYLNGAVFTADEERRVVSAVVTRRDRIVYLGDDAGATEHLGAGAIVMDLDGKMVLPGLHDMRLRMESVSDLPAAARELARNGLTSVQAAALPLAQLPAYRRFAGTGRMSFNLSAAIQQDASLYANPQGLVDVAAMAAQLKSLRDAYRNAPRIRVGSAQVVFDGPLEGELPPKSPAARLAVAAPPKAAVLQPYKQPLFRYDFPTHQLQLTGYAAVDTRICQGVRLIPEDFRAPADVAAFQRDRGHHPARCRIDRGELNRPAAFLRSYVRALDEAGFQIHAQVSGDRAVRAALDALDFAREENGPNESRHSLARVQLASPEDDERFKARRLYLVFNYGRIVPDPALDLRVIPFIDKIKDADELYQPRGYYMRRAYPANQLRKAGAVLAAGSEARLGLEDPRPFFHIEQAATRAGADGRTLAPAGKISVADAIAAYTINGAQLFGHDSDTGSLAVGKLADLVVIDRDLLQLEAQGRTDEISETRVLQTLFEGRPVYAAPGLEAALSVAPAEPSAAASAEASAAEAPAAGAASAEAPAADAPAAEPSATKAP